MVTPASGLYRAHKHPCPAPGRAPALLVQAPSVFQSQILNRKGWEMKQLSLLGPKNKILITVSAEPRNLNIPMYMRFLSDRATKLINDSSIWPAFIHLLFPVTYRKLQFCSLCVLTFVLKVIGINLHGS